MSEPCCKKTASEIVELLEDKAMKLRVSAILCISPENERNRMKISELFSDMAETVRAKYLKV